MGSVVQFLFRGKLFKAEIFIDCSPDPCYVFCFLLDDEIIEEFGDEVTLKTDFEKLLPKEDDYEQLVELRQAVFAAARNTSAFQQAKEKNRIHLKKGLF